MLNRILRGMAGFFIIISLFLAHYVDMRWLWFTALIGLNLLQSALTNWCPAMTILRMLGVKE